MYKSKCLVFPDGNEWIVFAPVSGLIMRTNSTAAEKFRNFIDEGKPEEESELNLDNYTEETFAPTNVTIVCSNRCGQKCVYCYGTPAHNNTSILNTDFCRSALKYVATHAPDGTKVLRVFFHGVGEPLFFWPLFTECVSIVRNMSRKFSIPVRVYLCTGGQVDSRKADWLSEHVDELHLSLDGPTDIQNFQRPRKDRHDSFNEPIELARRFVGTGKRLIVKSTITNASVSRMSEIVEFVAEEIGSVTLHLGMMFTLPWINASKVRAPSLESFVGGFGRSLHRGMELGIEVEHPSVSIPMLYAKPQTITETHFCLAPPNIVTAYYDVPKETHSSPTHGAYGWFDKTSGELHFDHKKRKAITKDSYFEQCHLCPCSISCLGTAGVKGRMPEEEFIGGKKCQARIGVLKEMLRRKAPPRTIMEKEINI